MHCNAEFYYLGKITRTGIEHSYSLPVAAAMRGFELLRRRKTVVGGKCALPSAVLVVDRVH